MTAIIHDLNEQDFSSLKINNIENVEIISETITSMPCIGCYDCWFKTPGTCKINDGLKNIGALLGNCEDMIIISQNNYGGYSESVKKIMDRCISGALPFFTYRSGVMRHMDRYKIKRKCFTVFLYGDFLEIEKKTAELFIEAHRSNMSFKDGKLHIIGHFSEIGNLLK